MLRRIVTIALFSALVAGLALVVPLSNEVRAESKSAEKDGGGEAAALDRIVFTNGNVTECRVISETTKTVTVMMFFGGKEMGEHTYNKTEIIEIQHGVGAEASVASRKEGLIEEEVVEEKVHPDAALIYLVEFEGQFGSDISDTPLRQMFEDVDENFDDLVPLDGSEEMVVDAAVRDKHIVVIKMDCGTDPRLGFDGIWRFKDLDEAIFEPEIKKGRRIVFWVENALNGAAIMPWVSSEIYFHSDGQMYFTSDLEDFDIGDQLVNEKQIALRLSQARGFAVEGGYEKLSSSIIKAMTRSRYWVYYKMEGGEAKFHNGKMEPEEVATGGWTLLTDDGKGDAKDEMKKRISNDLLVIDANLAGLIDLSKGVADNEDDLALHLDVHRNYKVIENRSERIFEKWNEAKEHAIDRINRRNGSLWVEFGRVKVAGDYSDRKRARGRQMSILKEIYSDYSRFAEVWDPNGQARSQISTQIEQIKKQQQADKAAQRG